MKNKMNRTNIGVVHRIHVKLLHKLFVQAEISTGSYKQLDDLMNMFYSILSETEEAVYACTLYPSEIVCPAHWAEWESEVHAVVG